MRLTGSLRAGWLRYRVLGMRITSALIAAAIVGGMLHSLIAGLIAGAVVFGLWQKRQTHRVIVEDLETGRITIQPMDDQTQRYLNSRKDIR